MATYYVRKTGHDDTGDGSTDSPWLSISKALATVSNGDTVLIGDGTYAENNGPAYLNINRVFTDWVTFQSEIGSGGSVIITNVSGTIATIVNASAAYIRFRYITFTGIAGTARIFRFNASADHFDLQNCTFTPVDNTASTLYINNSSAYNVSNISFSDCTISRPSTGATHIGMSFAFTGSGNSSAISFTRCTINGIAAGVSLTNVDGITFDTCIVDSSTDYGITSPTASDAVTLINCTVTAAKYALNLVGSTNWEITGGSFATSGAFTAVNLNAINNVTVTSSTFTSVDVGISGSNSPNLLSLINCTVNSTKQAFIFNGATNLTINGGTYTTTGAYATVTVGKDDQTGGVTTTGTIKNITINHSKTLIGHVLLIGTGCVNFVAENITVPQAYDYALVIKENTGTEVKNCSLHGGNTAALTYKAAISANAHNNTLYNDQASLFRLQVGDTGNKCQNWIFNHNKLIGSGTSKLHYIDGDAGDAGGGVCDNNIYRPSGTGRFGQVRSTNNISNLASLRAAWSGYGDGLNDSRSRMFHQTYFAHRCFRRRTF